MCDRLEKAVNHKRSEIEQEMRDIETTIENLEHAYNECLIILGILNELDKYEENVVEIGDPMYFSIEDLKKKIIN